MVIQSLHFIYSQKMKCVTLKACFHATVSASKRCAFAKPHRPIMKLPLITLVFKNSGHPRVPSIARTHDIQHPFRPLTFGVSNRLANKLGSLLYHRGHYSFAIP